jgi:hypothetical protein
MQYIALTNTILLTASTLNNITTNKTQAALLDINTNLLQIASKALINVTSLLFNV